MMNLGFESTGHCQKAGVTWGQLSFVWQSQGYGIALTDKEPIVTADLARGI